MSLESFCSVSREHFGRAAHVGLDDDGQFLDLARLHLLVQLLEGEAAGSWPARCFARFGSRKLTICLALAVSVTTWKSSPASGSESRPSTSTGVDGSALRICAPRSFCMARTLPNTEPQMKKSPTRSVPLRTSTVATGPRPRSSWASMHRAHGGTARVGLEVLQIGHQQNHFEQQIGMVLLRPGRHRHHDRVAAPVFGQQAAVGELLLDALGLGVRLVDLVDRHDDRHLGRSGVVDGFERLRHDAVVGRHHQNDDIGDLGAAGAHAGERFVTGRVDEDDLAAVLLHLVRADVLGDAAGLASRPHWPARMASSSEVLP